MGMLYYRERIQVEISQGKKHIWQSLREVPNRELLVILFHGIMEASPPLSHNIRQYTQSIGNYVHSPLPLVFRVFIRI